MYVHRRNRIGTTCDLYLDLPQTYKPQIAIPHWDAKKDSAPVNLFPTGALTKEIRPTLMDRTGFQVVRYAPPDAAQGLQHSHRQREIHGTC